MREDLVGGGGGGEREVYTVVEELVARKSMHSEGGFYIGNKTKAYNDNGGGCGSRRECTVREDFVLVEKWKCVAVAEQKPTIIEENLINEGGGERERKRFKSLFLSLSLL